jgi:Ca-activated chloride channel family protein
MTDGLPTQGETDAWRIVDNAVANRPADRTLRLFTFGVGYDVNTDLLNTVSSELGGRSSYVLPNERIDEVVGDFYASVSTPVLSDVRLEIGEDIVIDDIYPYPLPDLFAGEQLVVAGRYRAGGDVVVTLHGTVNGESRSFEFGGQRLANSGGEPFVARLWAMRKIAALIEQIRRSGMNDEALNQIVDLSLQYGIVTPYTSYLVQEPNAESPIAMQPPIPTMPGQPGAGGGMGGGGASLPSMRDVAKAEAEEGVAAMAAAPASGEAAVAASIERSAMQEATTTEEYEPVRYVEGKTFVRRGQIAGEDGAPIEFWVDTLYTANMSLEVVPFAGDRYFALAQDARWAKWLSVSPELIVVTDDGTAVRITLQGAAADSAAPDQSESEAPVEGAFSIWTLGEYFLYWLGLGPEPK